MSYEEISEKPRKAKVKHNCIWCSEPILPGETYIKRVYKFESDFQWDNLHPECLKALCASDDACEGFEPHSYRRGKDEVESAAMDDAEQESAG